jgi:hypothetical protein
VLGALIVQRAGDAVAAARVATERPELWLPGALAWLATLGWLPLLLAVARLPDQADLTFFGAGLASSGAWPWNAVALGAGAVSSVLAAFTLVAIGEAGVQRALRGTGDIGTTGRLLAVSLIAAIPASLAFAALGTAVAAVAPGEFQSPDIGGTVVIRIAGVVALLLLALFVAVVFGQAWGGAAQRRVSDPGGDSVAGALRAGLGDLRSGAAGTAVVALVSLTGSIVYLVVAWALLRVLWAPVGVRLAERAMLDAGTLLLLVGFIAIWLCLVLGGGALHAWSSAWWNLELADRRAPRAGSGGREGIGSA